MARQEHTGMAATANDNKRRCRILEIENRIMFHEHHINMMLEYAQLHVKNATKRAAIAREIGESRIEIECHLRPLLKRLVSYA